MPNISQEHCCEKEEPGDKEPEFFRDVAFSLDLVSAFAGDRPLTDQENSVFDGLKKDRGDKFFSDLLYTITHQYFPAALARNMWEDILRHKYEMSHVLMRNIRIRFKPVAINQ